MTVISPALPDAPGPVPSVPPRIELRGISKRFGATAALTDVSMDLRTGEIHALVGENGAGKSTLVKMLAGVHPPDAGVILLDGVPTHIADPASARAHRVAVVHQEPRLFPDLSVAENVFLADPPKGRFGEISWREMRRRGRDALRAAGRPARRRAPRSGAFRWPTSS